MIKAVFYKKDGLFKGFRISGHSGYAASGSDIVCAAVSSAGMLAANSVTDYLLADAEVTAEKNILSLMLGRKTAVTDSAERVINALYDHIVMIAEDYEGRVKVTVTEV